MKNLKVFKNFNELYNDSEFNKLETLYKQQKNSRIVEEAKQIIILNQDSFEEAVYNYTNRIKYWEIYDTNLPSDNGEVSVFSIDNPIVTIDKQNIKFIDEKFFIPIKVVASASVDYAVYKSDYWAYENLPTISQDLNKHYYLLEDTLKMIMKKTVSIPIKDVHEDMPLDIEIEDFDEVKFDVDYH